MCSERVSQFDAAQKCEQHQRDELEVSAVFDMHDNHLFRDIGTQTDVVLAASMCTELACTQPNAWCHSLDNGGVRR